MTRFFGKTTGKVDDKGRIVFPAVYRDAMARGGESDMTLIIKKNVQGTCLNLFTLEEWVRRSDKILDGLDTELGERGSGLSEGQAQRIAIARGLLHGGDILLLDEISSSLDEPTERELYHRLFTAYPQKTMLFITHRTAVSTLCDEQVFLKC